MMDGDEIKNATKKDMEERKCYLQVKYESIGKESRAISFELQDRRRKEVKTR